MTATTEAPALTVTIEDWEGQCCALGVEHYAKKLKNEADALDKLGRPAAEGEKDFAEAIVEELCPQLRAIPVGGTIELGLELRYLRPLKEGLMIYARALKSATGTLKPLGPDYVKTCEAMKANAVTIEGHLIKKLDPQSELFTTGEPAPPEDDLND